MSAEVIRHAYCNPDIQKDYAVYVQDLSDDLVGLPPERVHDEVGKIKAIAVKEGGDGMDVILEGIKEVSAVDLSELAEHGIFGDKRFIVVPVVVPETEPKA